MSEVFITTREIYDILVEVKSKVSSIERTLESNMQSVADHEARLRALEKVMWKAAGISAVLGTGGGYILSTFFS